MAGRTADRFTTITVEGAILPPDLLRRIAENDKSVEGLTPESYALVGEKLNEAISRSWNKVRGLWTGFRDAREKLPPGDKGAKLTREKWLLPLFKELDYGLLAATRPEVIDEKIYAVSHGWEHTPIHIVGCGVNLDERVQATTDGPKMSSHGLVQEFLNRSKSHLWAFVSNGLRIRILRDSLALTRQAFVEFDLEAMMRDEVYPDFVLFWMLCHASRVRSERPEDCWLEKWSRAAQAQGTRALDQLRDGVEKAIAGLGRGFLLHPANKQLRQALESGQFSKEEYYRCLLRLVYRLIFLFVAEDRDLLFLPSATAEAKTRYRRFYATTHLREIAKTVKGTPHGDLWQSLGVVMEKLGKDDGCPELGLPALGSFLWSSAALGGLRITQLSNRALLDSVRELTFTEERKVRRYVDYRNLGAEELGSIYESLLELHPKLNVREGLFELASATGNERKTTGSYYTPASLVTCLLDSALDPVLDGAAMMPNPEKAILALKVVDPACGSGHFLIAAAHRVAKKLALVRTGNEEPSPLDVRRALRDVIGHCIYGVDLNEMAVELCKVSLWMEALEPGRPLSFLDSKIRRGNALVGATPALISRDLPDEAFEVLDGSDLPDVVKALRKRNKEERVYGKKEGAGGQISWIVGAASPSESSALHQQAANLDGMPDDTIAALHAKEAAFAQFEASTSSRTLHLLADAWCSTFFWQMRSHEAITSDGLNKLRQSETGLPPALLSEVEKLRRQHHFFHWHLEFPEVFAVTQSPPGPHSTDEGWSGGFDLVLGNPPWETMSPDAKEFFSIYEPSVRFLSPTDQDRLIEALLADEAIASRWLAHCRDLYAQVHFFKDSGRYRLFAPGNLGKGDFNVYRMFAETALQLVRPSGRAAQIVPENFYNGPNAMAIRAELFSKWTLERLFGFENAREVWFKEVDTRAKFCLYSARRAGSTERFPAAFCIRSEAQLAEAASGRCLHLPVALVREFSPDALAVMELTSQIDVDITEKMYSKWPKFGDASADPPQRHYMREVDMGTDRDLFDEDSHGLPVFEGRMVDMFDYRAKGYRSGRGRSAVWEDLPFGHANKTIQPQWYVAEENIPEKLGRRPFQYRAGFCDVASPTNERALVASLIPPRSVCGDKVPTIQFQEGWQWALLPWIATANSFAMDFLARKKISLKMSYTVLDSLPFPRLGKGDSRVRRVVELALELACAGPEMSDFLRSIANEFGLGKVKVAEDEEVRLEKRAELDFLVAHGLFGLSSAEMRFILSAFPIVERRERERYGEYRSERMVLEHYRLAESVGVSIRSPTTAAVLPFKKVTPTSEGKYRTCLPLYSLKPAAGDFSDFQEAHAEAWVELGVQAPVRKGQFVAQVVGKSMEPLIPDGAYCLFQRPWLRPNSGEVGLFKLLDAGDPETGGRFTVKRLNNQSVVEDGVARMKGTLSPENPSFRPIQIDEGQEDSVQAVAIFVRALGPSVASEAGDG